MSYNILAINCGSSTLKFELIETNGGATAVSLERRLASGIIDRIGGATIIKFIAEGGKSLVENTEVADHGEATHRVLDWMNSLKLLETDGILGIGHRVVHGGDSFIEPTLINDDVIETIETLSCLAPLHNGPSLMAIRAARETLSPSIPMVAVFDTAFHHTLPEHAARYAIPEELSLKHRIKRYGFHGLAHQYMIERYAVITSKPIAETKLITLQLGNGCSATAVKNGYSVDTSMGFTPLEGLMMGTRSGDVDPSLVGFLARQENLDIEEVEGLLNIRSGLLGVSGRSRDMRELLEAERQGDNRAALAVEMFCYRVRKYIGAYLTVLGGADAIVFGGGIGENSPTVRARISSDMEWLGLNLDHKRNAETTGSEGRISVDNSRVHLYVIPVDEASIIARDTVSCLHRHQRD
jgi:acetate kinase